MGTWCGKGGEGDVLWVRPGRDGDGQDVRPQWNRMGTGNGQGMEGVCR